VSECRLLALCGRARAFRRRPLLAAKRTWPFPYAANRSGPGASLGHLGERPALVQLDLTCTLSQMRCRSETPRPCRPSSHLDEGLVDQLDEDAAALHGLDASGDLHHLSNRGLGGADGEIQVAVTGT